jgi:hypothetical protein
MYPIIPSNADGIKANTPSSRGISIQTKSATRLPQVPGDIGEYPEKNPEEIKLAVFGMNSHDLVDLIIFKKPEYEFLNWSVSGFWDIRP